MLQPLGRAFGRPLWAMANRNSGLQGKFVTIQRAIGGLVDELPEEGFTSKLNDTYWAKGAAIMVCQHEKTKDWLPSKAQTLTAWEGSMCIGPAKTRTQILLHSVLFLLKSQ